MKGATWPRVPSIDFVRVLLRALKLLALLSWLVSGLLVLMTILQFRGVVAPDLFEGVLGRGLSSGAGAPARGPSPRLPIEAELAGLQTAALQPAAAPGRAFLGFRLPDDGFCPDQRQRFEILPALSRVGFDAATPIDTFSAVSSDVQGYGEACPADPEAEPRAKLVVHTRSLSTGDAGRDRLLHESLEADAHPDIEFELDGFETERLDLASLAVEGKARCKMVALGSEQHFTVPVKMHIDSRQRLTVEGEVTLSLTAMGVEPGLVEDRITMWFGIRARAARSEQQRAHVATRELAHAR